MPETSRSQVFVPFLLTICGDVELNPGPRSSRQTKITNSISQSDPRTPTSSATVNPDETFDTADVIREIRELKIDLSGQIDVAIKDVHGRVDELKEEVSSLRKELERSYRNCEKLAEENMNLKDSVSFLTRELDDMKGRMKRDNLLIYGIEQSPNETWEESESKVKSFISETLDLDGSNFDFERVHRLTNAKSRPQPIIAKFSRFKQREQVLQTSRRRLKNTPFGVSEDFSPMTREARRKLAPFLKKARDEGKRAFLNYDKLKIDGSLYVYDEASKDICAVMANNHR
ncbi:uncharacterized protein [Ptychodera flava]|uniref:uncharacterized protein n=1 Tax=Ptychodera flava TaxID=63121 RepID=UPI00396A7C8E